MVFSLVDPPFTVNKCFVEKPRCILVWKSAYSLQEFHKLNIILFAVFFVDSRHVTDKK